MRSCAVLAVCLLGACQTTATDRPARLLDPDQQIQESLAAVVKQALGAEVAIAASAFTQSSALFVRTTERASVDQRPRLGRIMRAPFRFDLIVRGKQCVVVDARNQNRYVLEAARCEAVSAN